MGEGRLQVGRSCVWSATANGGGGYAKPSKEEGRIQKKESATHLRSIQNPLPPLDQRLRPLPKLELSIARDLGGCEGGDVAHYFADF